MVNRAKDIVCGGRRRGFTLAEALLAVVILGVAVSGVLVPFSSGASVQAEGAGRTLAVMLAKDLMEEIANTPFDDIIPQYDGYVEAEGQIRDAAGDVFTGPAYSKLSRDASCEYVYVSQQEGEYDAVFVLVTVSVHKSGREMVSLKRLVGQ